LIGRTLGHYQITGLLGKGGMGEVYRARDTRLDRDVALKVLHTEVATDPTRLERFRREAKIVAGLNHPHIVMVFSVEEDAGMHFITMELIDGHGLDQILDRNGLPLPMVFDIGIAVADALSAAHDKGVVHRDLKPANVRITGDGRVKVLDFGLAKLSEKFGSSEMDVTQIAPITREGTVVGTVPYMSPEQLRAQEVDHRSDIFSFGILLFEMATGHRPFAGATNTDVISSILRDTPAPVTEMKPDLPAHLGRIIARCLEKEPEARYQSAREVRDELRGLRRDVESDMTRVAPAGSSRARRSRTGLWLSLAAVVVAAAGAVVFAGYFAKMGRDNHAAQQSDAADHTRTIAVLPFVNMSPDPEQEFFSDGISEELLNLLSKVPDLRVAARTSSFSFKGENVEVPEIAKRLNVAYVLEGSVRKSGDQVRITAQLIHADDGFHVWSETYDRKFDDIFAIQDEIAADVVKQLQVTLLGDPPTTRKTDPQAYALYLQSVQLSRRTSEEAFKQSDALLHRVLEADSLYAPAWGALGANFGNRAVSGMMDPKEGFEKARAANNRALEIDPQYAPAHAGLAFIAMYGDGDFAAAAKHLERALEFDHVNGRALGNSATFLNLLGRSEQAVDIWKSVTIRDPVNINARFNLGTSQLYAGQLNDALESFRTVVSLSPDNGVVHYQMGVANLLKGDPQAALAEFEQEKIEVFKMIGLPLAYHALGRKADSDKALNELIANYQKDAAGNIAGVYAYRREPDKAFEWLEKERENGSTFAEINADPLYSSLHDDPRWLPFLRSIGKAPEQLDRIQFKVALPG
jgi:serine/threonine protein kinase/tetratricopeptide (TPR) repeat protein